MTDKEGISFTNCVIKKREGENDPYKFHDYIILPLEEYEAIQEIIHGIKTTQEYNLKDLDKIKRRSEYNLKDLNRVYKMMKY